MSTQIGIEIIESVLLKLTPYHHSICHVMLKLKGHINCKK